MKTIRYLYKSIKVFLKTLFLGGIIKTDSKIRNERLVICNNCNLLLHDSYFLFFKQKRCSVCGCYVREKTKYEFEKCPYEKW